jgi:hypothetical protein
MALAVRIYLLRDFQRNRNEKPVGLVTSMSKILLVDGLGIYLVPVEKFTVYIEIFRYII